MRPRTCPKCGQTLPIKQIISGVTLRGLERRILDIVHRAGANGIGSQELFDMLYGNARDGGPSTGVKIIAVHCVRINRVLRKHGLLLRATRGRGDNSYTLRHVEAA